MVTFKNFLRVIALFLSLIGGVYSLVYVIPTAEHIFPVLGVVLIILAAIPTWVKWVKDILGIECEAFPLRVGDEFTTSKGEHLKVVGFDEDGTPICREITE